MGILDDITAALGTGAKAVKDTATKAANAVTGADNVATPDTSLPALPAGAGRRRRKSRASRRKSRKVARKTRRGGKYGY